MSDENAYVTREQLNEYNRERENEFVQELVTKRRQAAENPDWKAFDSIPTFQANPHDWRKYVTADVRSVWDVLSIEARCAIIDICDEVASREHWD